MILGVLYDSVKLYYNVGLSVLQPDSNLTPASLPASLYWDVEQQKYYLKRDAT